MSVNRYQPHVLILPEDDANRQVATGFRLQVEPSRQRRIQVLPPAGGWIRALERFESNDVDAMSRYPERLMVLLFDFDSRQDRLTAARARIPRSLLDRVFIVGAWTHPEDLKAHLGSYETIGSRMAADCRDGTNTVWGHALLEHNASDLDRLRMRVRPILFGAQTS